MKTKIKNGVLDNLEDAGIIDITTNKQEKTMQNKEATVNVVYDLQSAIVGNDGYTTCVYKCTVVDKNTGDVYATKNVTHREASANCDLSSLTSIPAQVEQGPDDVSETIDNVVEVPTEEIIPAVDGYSPEDV